MYYPKKPKIDKPKKAVKQEKPKLKKGDMRTTGFSEDDQHGKVLRKMAQEKAKKKEQELGNNKK